MADKGNLGYSVFKIFAALFILTMVEVGWAIPDAIRDNRLLLWSGLLLCAFFKGLLILMYFMHMKYEKMIIWSLVIPTVPLVCVVLFALMPDLSFNDQRDHAVGHMVDPETGQVVNALDRPAPGSHGEESGH